MKGDQIITYSYQLASCNAFENDGNSDRRTFIPKEKI